VNRSGESSHHLSQQKEMPGNFQYLPEGRKKIVIKSNNLRTKNKEVILQFPEEGRREETRTYRIQNKMSPPLRGGVRENETLFYSVEAPSSTEWGRKWKVGGLFLAILAL